MEHRNGHPTLILSYRQSGKIVYEHPPRRIKNLSIDSLPPKILEEFFQRLLSLEPPADQRERGLLLRRSLVNLPLAVLFAADSYTLFTNPHLGRKKSSIEDDERAITLLLKHEGGTPWREVTPSRCSRWMYGHNLSDHARISIKRVMLSLFLHQAEERIIESVISAVHLNLYRMKLVGRMKQCGQYSLALVLYFGSRKYVAMLVMS